MAGLWVDEASSRALLHGLRLDVVWVKSTVVRGGEGVILAFLVENRALHAALRQVELLMARPCHLRRLAGNHSREERALLIVELVLQAGQETPSLDTV